MTFPVRYWYTGPTHYLMGLAPRTNYSIVNSGSTITITPDGAGRTVDWYAGWSTHLSGGTWRGNADDASARRRRSESCPYLPF